MDRIRRSFRDSFRRRGSKDRGLPNSASGDPTKPQQWQQDEASVRAGTCNFFVKYLGCVEVYESRGMQVCEEALKVLRAQRRRPVKGVLYVSGDGLRVVDAENKGLIVDQTIEKVSFCAPDRSHEKGFAYICRDGTTRRWMCHGFHAVKETGERLSHAVGCAFAVCLEKKQRRDRESQMAIGLTASTSNSSNSVSGIGSSSAAQNATSNKTVGKTGVDSTENFVRQGSFRQASLTERMQDPQNVIPAQRPPPAKQPAVETAVVPRPAPNPQLFERQGSLRMPVQNGLPFRRQHSLRIGELPSTLSRQQEIGGGLLPGARVSAIPEEDPTTPQETGLTAVCHELTDNMRNFYLANNVSTPEVKMGTGMSPTPSTARSRAEEWLESTLLSTTGQGTPRGGPSPQGNLNGYGGGPTPTPPPEPPVPKDIFGQPQFIPRRAPPLSQIRSQSLDTNITTPYGAAYPNPQRNFEKTPTVVEDPFEAKWQALEKRHSTNPFSSQSTGVNI